MAPPERDDPTTRFAEFIHNAFREGWRRHSYETTLSQHTYEEARRVLETGGWTGIPEEVMEAVRAGAVPGDSLPTPEPQPLIRGVSREVEVLILDSDSRHSIALLFTHESFPGVTFGHRATVSAEDGFQLWLIELMEEIETGALHRMMSSEPAADPDGIIWTTW